MDIHITKHIKTQKEHQLGTVLNSEGQTKEAIKTQTAQLTEEVSVSDLTTQKKKPIPTHIIIPNRDKRIHVSPSLIATNRSFVGRASRMTTGQQHAYTKGMELYGLSQNSLVDVLCDKNVALDKKIILDIGFGAGHSLVNMATINRDSLFIGLETFKPGIGALFVQAFAQGLDNIYVHHGDAIPYMFHHIDDNSLDRIQVFFPDPWQKKRYQKRRIIQIPMLQLCIKLLKPKGTLWIVTDWEPYALYIKEMLEQVSAPSKFQAEYLQHNASLELELEEMRDTTKFETKGIKKGHAIYPFVYQKIL